MPPTLTPDTLSERLIAFGAAVCETVRRLPKDLVTAHLARQLVRSATSPAANHAEARSAESRRDFVHKMQLCLKELREVAAWLELLSRLGAAHDARSLQRECDELIAIFVTSIKTASRVLKRGSEGNRPA
jgi:four helix bundle protein